MTKNRQSKVYAGSAYQTKPHEEWSKKPSDRRKPHRLKIPPGCIDVWQVTRRYNPKHHPNTNAIATYQDEALAFAHADRIHSDVNPVRVQHRAAIQLHDKFYLVNIPQTKFSDHPT